jgi:hypothetical protein
MNNYGLHSLRSGGASAVYKCDVSDRLFKVHGRWKSENAKDGYVYEDLEKRFSKPSSCIMYLYLLINKTQTQLKIYWRSDDFDVQRKQIKCPGF